MPGFHHLAIRCADLAACERFYRDVLGLEVLRRWPRPEGGDRSVWLAVGEGFLALERADRGAPAPALGDGAAGLHLVALRIGAGERAAWEERLRARGVAVVHRTPHTIYVRDPEGNRIGLSHWPQASEIPAAPPSPRPSPSAGERERMGAVPTHSTPTPPPTSTAPPTASPSPSPTATLSPGPATPPATAREWGPTADDPFPLPRSGGGEGQGEGAA